MPAPASRRLVLVGGGHAHVLVLEELIRHPLRGLAVTLVSDAGRSVYSGMVPGCVAGLYEPGQDVIELAPLARAAGARLVVDTVVGMDPARGEVRCQESPPLGYDLCSLDVGSTVRGLDVPGARAHALATRPIGDLVARLREREEELAARPAPHRVAVVGGGPAGVELALCLEARLQKRGLSPAVTLLDGGDEILARRGHRLVRVVRGELDERGVVVETGARVVRVDADGLELEGGRRFPAELVLWATGAAAQPFLRDCGLPLDEHGSVRVRETLQAVDHPEVLGAGDCVAFEPRPLAKAGVYAIRQGPVLAGNLGRLLRGQEPRAYEPQDGFLSLLATGDGRAVASWKGLAARGRWAWWLKDWIDRGFVERFAPGKLPS